VRRFFLIVLLLLGSAAAGWAVLAPSIGDDPGVAAVQVVVPPLDGVARAGERIYAERCLSCHGPDATGSDKGPPLVHVIYGPAQVGDAAFLAAVRRGVKQRHWTFGDMPQQPKTTDAEVQRVVAYVRALQRANGVN
jgi:mono/diheme cytochrome c family protein